MNAIYRITRMVELEPDPFKRLNMVSHIKRVEAQLRDLNQSERAKEYIETIRAMLRKG